MFVRVIPALFAAAWVAAPAEAEQVPFTATLNIDIGILLDLEQTRTGVATVSRSSSGGAITSVTIPAGAFATAAPRRRPHAPRTGPSSSSPAEIAHARTRT